jgi:hypothetical protein
MLQQYRNIILSRSYAMLSQNTKFITVNNGIKAVTKILCAEVLRTVEKKKRFGSGIGCKGKGHRLQYLKNYTMKIPLDYKAVMRMTPTQWE